MRTERTSASRVGRGGKKLRDLLELLTHPLPDTGHHPAQTLGIIGQYNGNHQMATRSRHPPYITCFIGKAVSQTP